MGITETLCYLVMILSAAQLVIALTNTRGLDSLGSSKRVTRTTKMRLSVSVLIPARNEEGNIRQCLQGLFTQDYEPLEILVLDDRSEDRTASVVQEAADYDHRIQLLSGIEPPPDWIGKNWACHQLAESATGEFLLFIDSDTLLSSGTISIAMDEASARGADLLSVIPNRLSNCLIERLLFPFIDWASFCWMPMKMAHRLSNPQLSAAFGQFMLFRRAGYELIGGHKAVRNNPFDDFELGRLVKRTGLTWNLFDGADCLRVLPYAGNKAAFRGVSRSLFPAFDFRVSVYALLLFTVVCLGFLPLLTLGNVVGDASHSGLMRLVATVSVGMMIVPWIIVCRRFRHSTFVALLYPFSIALMVLVSLHSLVTYSFGRVTWKDRRLSGRRIRF
jgi:chlorobactene glucosyltransferase